MAISKKTRDLVYKRDNYECAHCGTTSGLSIQHRINRQAGGSKYRDSPSNLFVLCLIENQKLEADARAARIARFNGWKLRSYEDPLEVPVWYETEDAWFKLDDKGGRAVTDPPFPARYMMDVPF